MGRVYAVASGKGGVGKTATVANLGTALATGGYDVAVVDADLGMGNLANALGVDARDGEDATGPESATLHDVLAGTADVEEATHEGPAGLSVVPGATDLDAFGRADPAGLGAVVDALDGYDYVLLDTSAGLSHDSVLPLGLADEVLLVSTTDPNALRDTEKTREVAERLDAAVAGMVLTAVGDAVDGEALDVVTAPVRGRIPADSEMRAAVAAGEPAVVHAPDSPAALAYRHLAADLFDESLAPGESTAETADDHPSGTRTPAAAGRPDASSEGEPAASSEGEPAASSEDEPAAEGVRFPDEGTGPTAIIEDAESDADVDVTRGAADAGTADETVGNEREEGVRLDDADDADAADDAGETGGASETDDAGDTDAAGETDGASDAENASGESGDRDDRDDSEDDADGGGGFLGWLLG